MLYSRAMPGLHVRVAPDVVGRLDEYLSVLRPLATSRGDVVRMLTALSTPDELRTLIMAPLKERIAEIVANAEITRQRDLPFVAHADGHLELPVGLVRVEVFPGQGRTEKEARVDLHHNLLEKYAGGEE